jgi:penicillin-binding protein 1A
VAQTTLANRGGGGNPAARAARAFRRRRRFPAVRWTLLAALVGLVSFVAGMMTAPIDLTVPARLPAALLLDAGERYFAAIRSPEIREDVPASAIPATLQNAVIAAEDERFFQHKGVDPVAILRAGYRDVFGGSRQGGSTITQQYVKNAYVGNEHTVLRKMREAALAYRAEQQFGKSEILIRYLNSVYLGNGTYGVQAASKFYFGVPVKDLALNRKTKERSPTLELARAAMLAGMVAAPSNYNPVTSFQKAKERQFYALERMSRNGFITPVEASRAYQQSLTPLAKLRPKVEATEAPIFTDMVTRELRETLPEDDLYGGGLRIKTTLDLLMQRAVEQSVFAVLPGLDPATKNAAEPDAAVVAIDPRNGDLKAIYGSRYTANGFNLATQARVQTGSAIKPFTLAAALQSGKTLDTVYYAPSCILIRRKPYYAPCNSERSERGNFTLRRALAYSVNTVYAKLADDIGYAKVKRVAEAAGMKGRIGVNPAMSLGAVEVSPLSVAQAYATLAAGGVRHDVRLIVEEKRDADTKKTFSGIEVMKADPKPKGRRVIPKAVADQVVEAMKDVVLYGTARAARQPGFQVFGKTGTTDRSTNAWFAGCRPDLCVVTWLGHKSGTRPLGSVHGVNPVFGGTLPARIFSTFWQRYAALQAAEALKENGVTPSGPVTTPPRFRPPTTRPPTVTTVPTPTRTTRPPVTTSPTPTATAVPTNTLPVTTPPPTTSSGSPSASGPGPPGPPP